MLSPLIQRRSMWNAINEAAGNGLGIWANDIHPINGLRVIREFEKVNHVTFDPMNPEHREKTYNSRGFASVIKICRALKEKQG